MENELYKMRSCGACLRDAYTWYIGHLKGVVKSTWWLALLTAFFFSLYYLGTSRQEQVSGVNLSNGLYIGIGLLGMVVFGVWLSARWLTLFNLQSTRFNVGRIVKAMLVYLCFVLVLAVIVSLVCILMGTADILGGLHGKSLAMSALLFIVVAAFLVALIPMVYSFTKYIYEPKQHVECVIGKPYRRGWRYWGFIFGTVFLAYLIYYIIFFMVCLPGLILLFAQGVDALGMDMGDASGLPASFTLQFIIIGTLSYFVILYISLWTMAVFFYVYGSIEARDNTDEALSVFNDDSQGEAETLPGAETPALSHEEHKELPRL